MKIEDRFQWGDTEILIARKYLYNLEVSDEPNDEIRLWSGDPLPFYPDKLLGCTAYIAYSKKPFDRTKTQALRTFVLQKYRLNPLTDVVQVIMKEGDETYIDVPNFEKIYSRVRVQ